MASKSFRNLVLLPPALVLALSCTSASSETYGFIATLGNDTTSVERVTRTGNRIVGDAVGRSPRVVRRHWEATLAPDGTIRSWTMDTFIPNATSADAELHHSAEFMEDRVRLTRRTSSITTKNTYTKPYVVTVPWNAFLYATYEVLFDVARNRPDTTHIGQYFFEGWDEGNIGHAQVRRLADGSLGIRSTGLAGEGVATFDGEGRMLTYSGRNTTYKQEVKRVDAVPDIDAIVARFAADEKAKGAATALSRRDTTRAMIGGAQFIIDYSRPLARGRTLVGGLIPYDRVWRTGANAATQMTVSAPIELAGIPLDSGTYTLWTMPHAKRCSAHRQPPDGAVGHRSPVAPRHCTQRDEGRHVDVAG